MGMRAVKWAHELKENCDYKFLAEIGLSILYPERLLPSQRFQHTAAEIGEMLRRHRVPDIYIYIYIYMEKRNRNSERTSDCNWQYILL